MKRCLFRCRHDVCAISPLLFFHAMPQASCYMFVFCLMRHIVIIRCCHVTLRHAIVVFSRLIFFVFSLFHFRRCCFFMIFRCLFFCQR